jgi:hypothetical protein
MVIEVGISQKWEKRGGLDEKARKWFRVLRMRGLQYILCVKVDKKKNQSSEYSYKLYDVPALNRVFPAPTPDPIKFTEALEATVHLNARCILGIHPNTPLPQGVNDPIIINLSYIRDRVIAKGYV